MPILFTMRIGTSGPGQRTSPARILVVDDDPAVRAVVRMRLEAEGYLVWEASSGEDALRLVEARGLPHLAIVDVMMPGMSGFELAEKVQAWCDLPIVMLTGVNDEQAVVRSIRLFAEDYVTKPFRPLELIARVERVLRRVGEFAYDLDEVLQVDGRLAVDFEHQRVFVEGQPVSLTPTETKLLYILMRSAGRPVSNNYILQRLWPGEERYEDVLRVHIYRLRQKIEPGPRSPQYLVTERDMGYCFIGPGQDDGS